MQTAAAVPLYQAGGPRGRRRHGSPLDYLGSAGLLWAINGGRLLELHRDWAVIDIPVHGSQRIFYRRNVDAAKITLPWARRD